MARNRIERSFRPMLESLENREMMDAGLGFALQIPLAPPSGGASQLALVSQLASETTQQINHIVGSAMQTAQQVNHVVHSALQTAQTAYSAAHQAAIDQVFAGLGHQNLPQSVRPGQQISHSVQDDSESVTQRAEAFLKDNIIEDSIWKNRWQLQPEKVSHLKTEVEGDRIYVYFKVGYGLSYGNECEVQFAFEGKNAGGVKRYDLERAFLCDWDGVGFVKGQFGDVAKELYRNNKIECKRFDENTFANNVIRQAEKMYGVKEGTFVKNKVERLDDGCRVLIYTDNNPFNPEWKTWERGGAIPIGKGELWLTFKYDDAQIDKGFFTVSEIRQGYHYWYLNNWEGYVGHRWQDTGDANVHAQMRGAQWKLGA